ncbi:MAG: fatty acyl-AMP ligase [Myxococcota bacterium]|nr:fatty acyl-AMP ligase [Myxococcota bacterium]
MNTKQTIGRALIAAAEVDGLGVNFWHGPGKSQHVSYAELVCGANRLANRLLEAGLRPGERVAIVLPTGPDFYHAFFGISLAGGVPTALYPPARLGRMDEWKARTAAMLTAARCVAVLTERRLQPLLGNPVHQAQPRMGCLNVAHLTKERTAQRLTCHNVNELAAVQFSSGSTGHPKPVMLSHDNMLSNAAAILRTLPGEPNEHSGVSWLPLYHDMGLVGCLLSAIVAQGPLTLMGPEKFVARPLRWLQALSETKATVSVAPNFAFGLTANKVSDEDLAGLDLSHWKVALCGAEPVHPKTLDQFAERFECVGFDRRALTPVYGLAEATLAVTFSPVGEAPKCQTFDREAMEGTGRAVVRPDGRPIPSLGRPLEGMSVAIRDEAGNALDEGTIGHVHVQGPGVMLGYLDQQLETARTLDPKGWLNTGDTGFLFNGELYLCGRAKDLIIINGRNHDPSLVEHALEGVAGLRPGCVAAFAAEDPVNGTERLVVLAETSDAASVDREQLAYAATGQIQSRVGLRVSDFRLLPPGTLPRTSSGKIRRREARKQWLNDTLVPPKKANVGLMIREMAQGLYHHALNRREKSSSVIGRLA